MNRGAACVMISMAAACFHAGLWAGVVVRDVAIQDLTPISPGLLVSAALAVATASPALAADKYVLGRCQVARPDEGVGIGPRFDGDSYLYEYHRAEALRKQFSFDNESTNVTLLKRPSHGEVTLADVPDAAANGRYIYIPNEGYVGRDRFAVQVEKDGVKVRIEYVMEVVPYGEHTTYRDENDVTHGLFCNPDSWKISQSDFNPSTQDYAAWLRSSELSSLIATASQSLTGFQDITGSSVG